MKYSINGCIKEMTAEEKKDYDWSVSSLNPVNLPVEPVLETEPVKHADWCLDVEGKRQEWLAKKVRPKRNSKLNESDAYLNADNPKNIELGSEVILLKRQDLRDMTDQFTEVPSDDDKSVTWIEF